MKKLILATITTAAFLPLCTTAQADAHSSETTASGMYVGATYGKGKANLEFDDPATNNFFDDSTTTMSLFIGMDLNETFAVEGFYANHGESKINIPALSYTATIKGTTMGLAVKAGTNFSDDIRGFVKLGYHSWKSESNENDNGVLGTEKDDGTDLLYGIGIEYKLSETAAVVAGYDRFTYNDSNITDMSIGIKYRF
jgi:OOP family OmpA-OmpF porin